MHGFKAASANLVNRHCRALVRQTCLDSGLPRRVLTGTGGKHLSENNFVDLIRGEIIPFQ